ncbi:YjdF family protein [Actinomyces timonensis]|uniref:YjdF family protein n=1 Tax=Actinomyces timonensis TaxID=1288391 RepID=UPI0002E30080|nr:YjdF family protein [Actinomyces timonensis]
MSATFTVYFNGQFWVGVLEHDDGGWVRAARVTFGPEPTDTELHSWLLENGTALINRADSAPRVRRTGSTQERRVGPKRAMREAAKAAARHRESTAAQAAMQADLEARAAASSTQRREDRDAERERRREIARAKAKARHRGH